MRCVRFDLSPAPRLAAAIAAAHGAAALSVLAVVHGVAGWMLAGALAALGGASAWSRALLRAPRSVRALEVEGTRVVLELASGERLDAQVAERCYVSRFLVALVLVSPVRRTLLIVPGMLGTDAFRRLRLWALWRKLPGAAPAALVAPEQPGA